MERPAGQEECAVPSKFAQDRQNEAAVRGIVVVEREREP